MVYIFTIIKKSLDVTLDNIEHNKFNRFTYVKVFFAAILEVV